jgi:hypothetical protein
MIADPTCGAVSFLAAGAKSRLRLAAPAGRGARLALAHSALFPDFLIVLNPALLGDYRFLNKPVTQRK